MRHPFKAFITLSHWLGVLLIPGCTWEPVARPVQPEQVFEGPARVERMLDSDARFALVQAGMNGDTRWRIVNGETLSYCELPGDFLPIYGSLLAPTYRGDDAPKLLLPVQRAADNDDGLYFSDEKCTIKGPLGSLVGQGTLATLSLHADQRQVLLVLDDGVLTVVDPWTNASRLIGQGITDFRAVDGDNRTSEAQRPPDALWLIENKKVVQRALDGTLLLSLGTDVSQLQQRRFDDGLRIAFRDGNDVFEAKGPSFTPQLIAENACSPIYRATSLDLHFPCTARQLVRIELTTGAVRRFLPGVFESTTIGGFDIERLNTEKNEEQLWVVSGTKLRAQIVPLPLGLPVQLGTTAVVGRTRDGRFGAWNLRGDFTPIFSGVRELWSFRNVRTSELEWLMLHDMQNDLGRISSFDQRDVERMMVQGQNGFQPRTLAEGVPVGGFRLHGGVGPEPIVLSLEQASPMQTVEGFAGTLHARLLSGALEVRIDDGVSSNQLVVTPAPGILYGITEGPKSGLWFAAL
jgi:hypothetical protein